MGAVANMIHPLAGKNEIVHYLNEVNGNAAILFEGTYHIVQKSLHKTALKKAVIVSAGDSLPFGLKQLYMLKNKLPRFSPNGMLMNWKQFMELGHHTNVVPVKKDSSKMAIISHTGGTTGEPKGVMLSDRNINALIWQLNVNFKNERQKKNLVVLPPFVNYSLVHGMLLPLALGVQVTLIPRYEADRFDEYVRKYKPNHISSIPPYLEALLTNQKLKTMDLSCIKTIAYGGEAMNVQKEQAVNELLRSCGSSVKISKRVGLDRNGRRSNNDPRGVQHHW